MHIVFHDIVDVESIVLACTEEGIDLLLLGRNKHWGCSLVIDLVDVSTVLQQYLQCLCVVGLCCHMYWRSSPVVCRVGISMELQWHLAW